MRRERRGRERRWVFSFVFSQQEQDTGILLLQLQKKVVILTPLLLWCRFFVMPRLCGEGGDGETKILIFFFVSFIPAPLSYCSDIFSEVSSVEVAEIMMDVWNFLREFPPEPKEFQVDENGVCVRLVSKQV